MKTFLLALISIICISQADAQVAGNKYTGIMNIPHPVKCVLSFSADTLYLLSAETVGDVMKDQPIEIMTYTIKNNTVLLKKVNGLSPCDNSVTGTYKLEDKGDQIFITMLDDACVERGYAWTKDAFIKMK